MSSLSTYIRQRFTRLVGLRKRLLVRCFLVFVQSLPKIGLGNLVLGLPFSVDKEREHCANFRLLYTAEMIDFASQERPYTADPFLRSCQYMTAGRYERANIFTCEFPNAKFLPENGLLFDQRWRIPLESILYLGRYFAFRKTFRPRKLTRRNGVFSSIQHPWHYNNWHWAADSLPQVYSLAVHMQGRPLTLLMSNELGRVHRASLDAILPENFTLEYVQPEEWFELENFVMPSHVAGIANAFFPPEYYEFIRSRTFARLATPRLDSPVGRFYISRARARHRRVLNETALMRNLEQFGFLKIFMEDYTFAQQVELFRNAEAIVSPHSAALGGIIYADHAKVCVLYPQARPAGYFYTLARGVGLEHFCTNDTRTEDEDFEVDLTHLHRVLTEEMHLEPLNSSNLASSGIPPQQIGQRLGYLIH